MSEGFFLSVFPVETVVANMRLGGVSASSSEVERLWTAYKKAVDSGLTPYSKAGGGVVSLPLLQAMEKDTGYVRGMIAAFLTALEKAVKVDGWDWKWLDPRAAKDAGQSLSIQESIQGALKATGQGASNLLAPALDPVTNVIKYASLAAIGVAVIYGIYQFNGAKKIKRLFA